MMTDLGTAAEGPPAADDTRRIAAESVSPQLVAVLGSDTELRFAVIPVITKFLLIFVPTKVSKISYPANDFSKKDLLKMLSFSGYVKISET
ncbi:MAG: hypothetical protein J5875_04640 [Paludibacteraceae bacterium]|nr:hypothetical protein [Paludibacteraceae bacterium]